MFNMLLCTVNTQTNYKLSLPQINHQGKATEFVTLVISGHSNVRPNISKEVKTERTLTYYSCEYKLCARSSAVVKRCGLLFGAVYHLSLQKTGQIPSTFPGLLQEYSQGQV